MLKINLFIMISFIMFIMTLIMLSQNTHSHPILILITIIIYSMMMSMNMSLWKMNFMYSILLFLMMISGLLIIFLYFSSLISNEQMNISMNFNFIMITMLNIMLLIINIINKKYYTYSLIYSTKDNLSYFKINDKMFQNILNLYIYPFNNLTIMCMMFLLICLFSIIKMTSMKSKPLRKITN